MQFTEYQKNRLPKQYFEELPKSTLAKLTEKITKREAYDLVAKHLRLDELEYHTTFNNPIIHMMLERWMKLASDRKKLVERFQCILAEMQKHVD